MRLTAVFRFAVPAMASLWLASCAFLIPEDESTPRYNTVVGEPRRPQLNSHVGAPAAMAAPVPVVQQSASPLPPVDPAVQREAQQRMQLAQATPQESEGFFDGLAFWRSGAEPDASMRTVPEENRAYPELHAVPPRPALAGPDAAATRLNATRSELENSRGAVNAAGQQLHRDAASEPSLLNEPRPTVPVVPAPEPISSAPVPPPGMAAASPVAVPFPDAVAPATPLAGTIAMLPPPPPVFAVQPAPAAPAPIAMAAAPAAPAVTYFPPQAPAASAPAGMEPIVLRPPVAAAPPAFVPTPAPMAAAPQPMAPAISGGFDPMADAAPRASYASVGRAPSTGYLPASRYTGRR